MSALKTDFDVMNADAGEEAVASSDRVSADGGRIPGFRISMAAKAPIQNTGREE